MRLTLGAVLACVAATAGGCGTNDGLRCDDLLPASQAPYSAVAALVIGPGPKSCSSCHNAQSPVYGYDFEGPGVSYEALTTHMPLVYAEVASGRMPKAGQRWTDADLQLLASWYCQGAFYAP